MRERARLVRSVAHTASTDTRGCATPRSVAARDPAHRSVDRVHLLSRDLDWAPAGVLHINRLVIGSLVVGAAVPAFLKFGPLVWFVPGLVAPAALRAGNRAARAVVRRRFGRYARGEVNLAGLQRVIDGALMQVSGTVDADATIPGLIEPRAAVYRRAHVALERLELIHEAAVDFSLTDHRGQRVRVLAAGSRLLSAPGQRYMLEGAARDRVLEAVRRPDINMMLRRRGINPIQIMAAETLIQPGDRVHVVGTKTRVVDDRMTDRLARDDPFVAALCSSAALPLLIARPQGARRRA